MAAVRGGRLPSGSRPRIRSLVTFTFALDHLAYDAVPRGYGFSNLALYIACVAAVWLLARAAQVAPLGATIAAFAWAVNPHGIRGRVFRVF